MAISECQWLGVTMETASRLLSSRARRMSWTQTGVLPASSLHDLASGGEQPAVGIDQVGDLDILHPAESCDVAFVPAR